ncbi:hypothetical protein FE782_12505 [Paenibacillus antri]|uniref:Polyprenyl synthetase n=1 Tax=Paenibacillus antri TaxID=2582848 RepID=A0A5R9G5T3_9BACL|nr:hypothetical protein [Paenibacillus antri]TLS51732.1 hypothetical protein FE782_12505 [Paenibacillus antri]
MNEIERYREELARIFAEAEKDIAAFPDGPRDRALRLLERSDPLRNGGRANAISYLLPYWARERTNGPLELCRDLAIGNIHAMLRFFLLDDAMDGAAANPESLRESLALVPLLEERFLERYRRHFPGDSMLWSRYRVYLEEWASAVYAEGRDGPMDPRDGGALARKAAPAKIGVSGMLIRAGQAERLPAAEEAVELALAVLQLSDDRADWREDLPVANGSGNAFLTLVRERLPSWPVDESEVRRAMYNHGVLDRLADIAGGYVERLERNSDAPDRLVRFAQDIVRSMRGEAEAAAASKRRLALEGGFAYFLSKMKE